MEKISKKLLVILYSLILLNSHAQSSSSISNYNFVDISLTGSQNKEFRSTINVTYLSKFFKINPQSGKIEININYLNERLEKKLRKKSKIIDLKYFRTTKSDSPPTIELIGQYNNNQVYIKIAVINDAQYRLRIMSIDNSDILFNYTGYFRSNEQNYYKNETNGESNNMLKTIVYEVFDTYKDVKDPFLNVRSTPDRESNILIKLKDESKVNVFPGKYGKYLKWVKIYYRSSNTTGYVHSRYLRKI